MYASLAENEPAPQAKLTVVAQLCIILWTPSQPTVCQQSCQQSRTETSDAARPQLAPGKRSVSLYGYL